MTTENKLQRAVIKQILLLIAITFVYLTFELGFNARLLDVVGSGNVDDVHNIEIFGRTLSGIAVALFVFGRMMDRRIRSDYGNVPSLRRIALFCVITIAAVFFFIKALVDGLVVSRDTEFRRMAMNTTLLQSALIDGRVTLTGLSDDEKIFARPEGKAFLALFPLMAVSVNNLEERIKNEKEILMRQAVAKQIGAAQYYKNYTEAIRETHKKWLQYARIPTSSDQGLRQEQDKAWSEYQRSLSRHRWTPDSVPANRRATVVNNVRRKVPVPPNWDPADEATFREAVEQKYRRAMASSARSVTVSGDVIPPGLPFPAFVARPGVQRELRNTLKLPPSATVATSYATSAEFMQLFDQAVALEARKRLERFTADERALSPGGIYYADAEKATRAAIVPPIALFFSLLGAITHFTKLLYLITKLVMLLVRSEAKLPWRVEWSAKGALAVVFLAVMLSLNVTENSITRSDLFGRMMGWMQHGPAQAQEGGSIGKWALTRAVHIVAVGQGYGYPLNESIRMNVLQGLNYGYHPVR
ncbi:hypothetical protein PQR62_05455 [Herbaspirillum lusitanum]|uniref:Uncharacterized protein n=1 Tax=Herbaspirillum lusitanum TaxID=213312 RepID=A0ABW9A5Q5_9BURK